jgi:hypothetical protein
MALKSSTEATPLVTEPEIDMKSSQGEELQSHVYWAQHKGHSSRAIGAESVVSAMHYSVAKMLKRWPNPELDPSHLITEKEFDAAIEEAAGASMAKQPAKESN